jgi:hypothetical protein
MSDVELRNTTGKGFGGPGCAVKQIPLMLPSAEQKVRDRTAQHLAKGCESFGKPAPAIDAAVAEAPIEWGPVFFPNPNPNVGFTTLTPGLGTTGPRTITSCQGCAHFVSPSELADKTGWAAGACLAKGTLLLMDRLSKYARSCDKSAPLDRAFPGTLDHVKMWFPEYTQRYGEKNKEEMAAKQRSTDPIHWVTEKEVTANDRAQGIRAWRKIEDPEGFGEPVYFPIMDLNFFSPEEQELIPRTGDDEHPEIYHDHGGFVFQLAVLWQLLDGTPGAWGPPGVGKTELGRHMAWMSVLPFARFSISGSSEVDDLAGSLQYSPTEGTVFKFGRLARRWQKPGIILIDEPNVGPPDVWQLLRPLTDNSKQFVLDQAGGPILKRNKLAYMMMALNPAWSLLNVGTNTISDADQRRMMHLWMDLPPADVERSIITDHCMVRDGWNPARHLDNIMKIAGDIRNMVSEGTLPVTWGIASQIKVARLLRHYAPMTAYKIAVLNYLDPTVAQPVVDAIQSYYPS